VSAGKTTLLNALLRDKYGEVSMKRTTAGINLFRLHRKPKDDDAVSKDLEEEDNEAELQSSGKTDSGTSL
jgi:GTPase SAR1 family protein